MDNYLKTAEVSSVVDHPSSPRKPYEKPELKTYGRLTLLTQASPPQGPGDGGSRMSVSDPRTKQDILEIGRHPAGFGLYLFSYKPEFQGRFGSGRQFGVMADEVESIVPGAVAESRDGLKMVNYARLGIAIGD